MATSETELRADPLRAPGEASGRMVFSMDVRQALGIALIALGVVGVVVAWYGISGTLDPGEQMPYLASGGIGGLSAVALGLTLIIAHEHSRDRDALELLLQRLDDLDERLAGLEQSVSSASTRKRAPAGNGRARAAAPTGSTGASR